MDSQQCFQEVEIEEVNDGFYEDFYDGFYEDISVPDMTEYEQFLDSLPDAEGDDLFLNTLTAAIIHREAALRRQVA